VKLAYRELYFDLNKNLWAPQTFAYATLWQSVTNLTFCNVFFNFATAILKFDTFSLYHIVRTQIAKVTASFSLFALSELVCTKKVPYPIHYSLFIYPKLILLWSVTDGWTDKILHPFTPSLFSFGAFRSAYPFFHHR
jgi:hypothetical protein